jgi:hypothetical protein
VTGWGRKYTEKYGSIQDEIEKIIKDGTFGNPEKPCYGQQKT